LNQRDTLSLDFLLRALSVVAVAGLVQWKMIAAIISTA
jgi:hypothetical protein